MSIIEKAALWISQKRLRGTKGTRHDGLLPAGFSAEHLGPNDYYYWDDFFGVAGLESAASLAGMAGDTGHASQWKAEAVDFRNDLMKSIREAEKPPNKGIPASPYRRMDAGAVGSITGAYPLDVMEADDERVRGTVDYLLKNCFFHWGFFQHITHSGINVYLSLQIAQLLLMQGDPRYLDIIHAAADLASPTGQWPEAIHPRTLGGCMGDGQHGWASAEWLMMMRSLFVREKKNSLVLGAGIQREWLDRAGEISYGPALTRFGPVTVKIRNSSGNIHLEWEARWHNPPELVHAGLFGTRSISVGPDCREVVMESSSQ